jgi:hypothetical protein
LRLSQVSVWHRQISALMFCGTVAFPEHQKGGQSPRFRQIALSSPFRSRPSMERDF